MTIAHTSPPAKLNLFLEIPAKRKDGYHEIDTVMAAIDWRDELRVESIPDGVVEMTTSWLPSARVVADQLGFDGDDPELLRIPSDGANLVVRALELFRRQFDLKSGFRVTLGKRIPAGAGMGGASSDAAHAITCAAQIHQVTSQSVKLHEIAASIGSDVPFFLPGMGADSRPCRVAHAGGRGEVLSPLTLSNDLHFVVVYPAAALSTAGVYQRLVVPHSPISSSTLIAALKDGDLDPMAAAMMNRLADPALEILPQLVELLESLWQSELRACQLTGSGSACFGIADSADHAQDVVKRLRAELQPGVLLRATQTVPAAAPIEIEPS